MTDQYTKLSDTLFKEHPYNKDISPIKAILCSLEAFSPEQLDRIERISGNRFDLEAMKKSILGVDEALKGLSTTSQMYIVSLLLAGLIYNAKLGQFDHHDPSQIGYVFDSYMNNAFVLAQVSYIQCYWRLENRVTN